MVKTDIWVKNTLLVNMSDLQLAYIERIAKIKTFKAGELIIKEGDTGDTFFLIISGKLSIYKEDEHFLLAEMGAGDSLGLMALIDGKPRSANAKAITEATVVEISLQQLSKLDLSTYMVLIQNQLRIQQDWLRNTNDANVSSLKRELIAAKKQNAFASFFITIIVMMCFYVFIMRICLDNVKNSNTTTFITSGIILGFVLIAMVYIKTGDYPLSAYGLTMKNAKAHIKQASLWTLAMMAIGTFIKILFIYLMPGAKDNSILSFPVAQYSFVFIGIITLIYAVFSFGQEFIARGLLQGSLHQVLVGKYADTRAVVASTLIFASTHLHLGSIYYSILVSIPSLIWGFLYVRQRSLVGVTFAHIIFGIWMTEIVGFPFLA